MPRLRRMPGLPMAQFSRVLSRQAKLIAESETLAANGTSDIAGHLVEGLPLRLTARQCEKGRVPNQGPVLFVSNKPIASAELLALFVLLREVRPDLKLCGNDGLEAFSGLDQDLLCCRGQDKSTPGFDSVEQHLLQGGAALVVPAKRWSKFELKGLLDGRWRPDFLTWANCSNASIVPIYLDARAAVMAYYQSFAFWPMHNAKWLQPLKPGKKTVVVRVGRPIENSAYSSLNMPLPAKARLFRKEVDRLGRDKKPLLTGSVKLAQAVDPEALAQELEACDVLGQTNDAMSILLYRYSNGSHVLDEIGRLREHAFRLIGEGTGRELDTDSYDQYYDHIVLWDAEARKIAGAYRLQPAMLSLRAAPGEPLYTQTLFDYQVHSESMRQQGLELGRSFVHPDYWGSRSLDYLWLGIAAYLRNRPKYRYLFGAVSISNSFSKPAQDVLVYYYSHFYGARQALVRAKQPFAVSASAQQNCEVLFDGHDAQSGFVVLKQYLRQLGYSVPMLYKQYTSLCEPGAVEFHGFNVDPKFSDCIDGLVVVDVTRLLPNKAQRYELENYSLDNGV